MQREFALKPVDMLLHLHIKILRLNLHLGVHLSLSFILLNISQKQKGIIYANGADVLNVAWFGMTAKEWRTKYSEKAKKGNIRDDATLEQLIILTNGKQIPGQNLIK